MYASIVVRALARQVHGFVRLEDLLLQVDVEGVRDFALLDFSMTFFGGTTMTLSPFFTR